MSHYKPYPAYKKSGDDWPNMVPQDWQVKRLKFSAKLNPPIRDDIKDADSLEVSFVPMEDIGEDNALRLEKTRPVGEVKSGYSYFEDGDIAFAKVTPCFENGKGALMKGLVNGVGFGTTELTVLRPGVSVTPDFLNYVVRTDIFRSFGAGSMTGAGGLKRVPDEFTRNYVLALPSVDEQNVITKALDSETTRIDALVAKKERFIEILREKRQAIITQAVTKGLDSNAPLKDSEVEWLGRIPEHWVVKELKYVATPIIGLTYSPEDVVEEGEGVLVLRSSNIQNGKIVFGDNVYVSAPIPERLRTRVGDIVMCSRNGSRNLIGKNGLIEEDGAGLTFGAFTTVIRSALNNYLYFVLNSALFKFQSGRFLTTTINQLTTETLKSFEVPLPPEAEREAVALHLKRETSRIDALIQKSEQSIKLLKERRSALITAVVTGQIDLREVA